jgi:hypothetical protein
MDGAVWVPNTGAAGWGKLNHVNFDYDWWLPNRRYWTGFGIKDGSLTNLAEVGLYCIYGWNNIIQEFGAYFSYIDNGYSPPLPATYALDPSDMGKYFFFKIQEISSGVWQGGFQLQDGSWHWFDSHPYASQWIGVWKSSIESIHQPSSGQSGSIVCAWYDISTRDWDGIWNNCAIDYKVNGAGYYCHAAYPVPDKPSNSWFSFVQDS